MAQDAIGALCQVWLNGQGGVNIQFDANANVVPAPPTGTPLDIRCNVFKVDDTEKRGDTTVIRAPGQGRGVTGTLTTSSAKVSLSGFVQVAQNAPAYEGADWVQLVRRKLLYISYQSGTLIFKGAILLEDFSYSGDVQEPGKLDLSGTTQGNYTYIGDGTGYS